MRHHVVGVDADQQVGEDVDVADGLGLVAAKAFDQQALAGTGQRHRLPAVHQLHPAAHPRAGAVVVAAAVRGADRAQLGVDRRAVVALVVVLRQHLPVGVDHVLVAGQRDQRLDAVGGDDLVQSAQLVRQRARVTGGVDEDVAVPLLRRDGHQRELGGVEPGHVTEVRGGDQPPVQGVGPGVVRADDGAVAGRRAFARQQLVPAVPAGVRERPQLAVVTTHQQQAVRADVDGPLVTGRRQLLAAAHAHPPTSQEVLGLPREDGIVDVGLPGQQPAAPERLQNPGDGRRVQRRDGVGHRRGRGHSRLLSERTVSLLVVCFLVQHLTSGRGS